MTNISPGTTSMTTTSWKEVGAWYGGTVTSVALVNQGPEIGRGLLASRAGVYGWSQAGDVVEPLLAGMSDLNVVAVAFAGGDAHTPATAFAATVTGRLFRLRYLSDRIKPFTPDQGQSGEWQGDQWQSDQWQEVTSWAGLGVALVLAPSPAFVHDHTLFIGTPAGIYRTQDDGQSWESCNFGLLDEDVLCMACAPDFAESELLWAGTAGGGLYRSRNSGRAWRESGYGLPDAAVQSLAVSPNFTEDRTLFVGLEEYGVYVSRDGGENWASLGLTNHSVNSLACPQAGVLLAGTEDGLWRMATERGEATQVMGAGEVVLAVAATPAGHVAAGIFGRGIWITEDGSRWLQPQLALHTPPIIVAVGTELFALDSDGLMARSRDGGASWLEMESATADSIFALDGSFDAAGELVLFAASGIGISRWDAAQEKWELVAAEAFYDETALAVDLSPSFASDNALLVMAHEGELLLSQNAGTSWTTITGPWQEQSLLHARFAPDAPSTVIALAVQPTESGHFAVTVWRTVDLGKNWEPLANLTSGVPAVTLAWPEDPQENALFIATQHRVIKLYNEAKQGTLQVHQHFFDEDVRVTALAPEPDFATTGTIWAATSAGLYRSVDRGLSWGLTLELPADLPLVWLEATSTHLRGVALGGGVWAATL